MNTHISGTVRALDDPDYVVRCPTCGAEPRRPCQHATRRMPLGLSDREFADFQAETTLKHPHDARRRAARRAAAGPPR